MTAARSLEGRVALVTGAARGQGRSHAVHLAREGADVIALDACGPVGPATYEPATPADLDETTRLVAAEGGRVLARRVDVRDLDALEAVVGETTAELGRLDVVVANAGLCSWGRFWELRPEQWHSVLDTNVTGVWHTLRCVAPIMIDAGRGGSIVVVSSVAGLRPLPGQAHYSASKHAVVGLAGTAAIELAPYDIRVNTVHPWGVATPMGEDRGVATLLREHPDLAPAFRQLLTRPRMADPQDISDAVVWLASDRSRTVTGIALPVDLGATAL